MPLLSFHNSQEIKDKYVNRLKHHQEQDNIIQGTGWENGKGCAVGCTLENYDHNQYPIEIGIPIWLSKVEDKIFEGLCNEDAKEFPIEFLQSIPIGVDLDKVKIPFLIIIVESVINTFDHKKFTNVLKSIEKVLKILKNNNSCFSDADAAYAAAAAADAAYAAYAAAAAAAAAAAYAAAADAAYAASAAAYAAAYADAAYADAADYGAALERKYKYFADNLIKLLKECK